MKCPRCGARWRSDPQCGKSIHLSLPERPVPLDRGNMQPGLWYVRVDQFAEGRSVAMTSLERVAALLDDLGIGTVKLEDQLEEDMTLGLWMVELTVSAASRVMTAGYYKWETREGAIEVEYGE